MWLPMCIWLLMGKVTYNYIWVYLPMGMVTYGCGYLWVWLPMGVVTYG